MKPTAYLLQAALICAWWVGLAGSRSFFAAFQFDGIQPIAFWSFFDPDMILIAGCSVLRAYRRIVSLEYVIVGAFGYASLYCVNATLLTHSGYLPTSLMLLGLGYNLFLCLNQSVFRNASSSLRATAAKTLVQVACVWSLTLGAGPYIILDAFETLALPHPASSLYLGMVLFACCSVLGLTSAYVMVRDGHGTPLPLDQPNKLVVTGPYRFVRNPMAIAGIGQGLAIALAFRSIPILVYSLLGAAVWQLVVRHVEERNMLHRFGDAYAGYQRSVPCWLPRISRRDS